MLFAQCCDLRFCCSHDLPYSGFLKISTKKLDPYRLRDNFIRRLAENAPILGAFSRYTRRHDAHRPQEADVNPNDRNRHAPRPQVARHPQAPAKPHMRRAPHPNRATGSRQASRPGQAPHNPRTRIAGIAAALILIALVGMGGTALFRGMLKGGDSSQDKPGGAPIIEDTAAGTGAGEIVIGLNGDEDTYVLKGEKYLEAGAHAAEPTDGLLSAKIKTSGEVDTSKPGTYKVTYRVSDSSGHTAKAVRAVHVVESMETMQGGVPILMYHYVYDPAAPPADLNGNFIASTAFEQQLSYLKGNDFYFPSYPEVKAFIEGRHSLPAKSVVLTFDDGETGFLNVGVPLLEKYRVPATSFVIASDADAAQKVIDHRSPYVAFESHSFGMHKPGGNVGHGGIISAMSRDEIAADLKHAQEIVGGTQAFAYPFGDVTDDGRAAVLDAGTLCAFTTQNSWAHVSDDVTALPRVRISGEYSLDSFIALVNG